MRLVIVNEGEGQMSVGKDGVFYTVDSTGLAENIHAVQWSGSTGEIERKDPATGKMVSNEEINSIADFQFAVDAWQSAYDAEQAAIAEAQAE